MRLPPDDPDIPFVDYLCERNADCIRLIGICDRAILLSPGDRAAVEELRAVLKLPMPAHAVIITRSP